MEAKRQMSVTNTDGSGDDDDIVFRREKAQNRRRIGERSIQ